MKTMQSKYPGTCAKCGKPFAKGELINYYGRGRGVEHAHQCRNQQPTAPDGKCWQCGSPDGYFRNLGAATPVWCESCWQPERKKYAARFAIARQDNSSHEDRACGDMAYEDACAAACGGGL